MTNASDSGASYWATLSPLLNARSGHFEFESRHHGALWFELEALFRVPDKVTPLSTALANRLAPYEPEIICGPLVEGAFVAMQVASALDVSFVYTERHERVGAEGLFPIDYTLPGAIREMVRGKRVAIANDIISAGSAVKSTLDDLQRCGANVVAIGALANLGDSAAEIAEQAEAQLETLVSRPNAIFTPDECPQCKDGIALVPHPGS